MDKFEEYLKAAENGDAEAQVKVADCYYEGDGVEQDYPKAVEWYTKAAEQGNAEAQSMVGKCYFEGVGVEQDYDIAFEWTSKSAEQDNYIAQYNLGVAYANGNGVVQDYNIAFQWFTKSAKSDNPRAYNMLGLYFSNGLGVRVDYKQAFEMYKKSAEQGFAEGQSNLGYCYYSGDGVGQDFKQAFVWYLKAAKQGFATAQYYLGNLYRFGKGVEKDEKRAFMWVQKAAEQGYATAQNALGYYYDHGIGVTRNPKKAIEWYTKAKIQGNETAKINLGYRYVYGNDEDLETKKQKIRRLELLLPFLNDFKSWIPYVIILIIFITAFIIGNYIKHTISFSYPAITIFLLSIGLFVIFAFLRSWCNRVFNNKNKEKENLLKEVSEQEEEEQRKKAAAGDKEAQERILATKKKKSIDEIVKELNSDKIIEEHTRAKIWYWICLGLFGFSIGGFVLYIYWNVTSICGSLLPPLWQEMLVRVFVSMSLLTMIFILMNQAARSRKTMVLLSKEIQEYKYIGALLKGKVGLFPDKPEIDDEINKTLDAMIKLHLDIQAKRLEKEDHTEVKDITPEILTFYKDSLKEILSLKQVASDKKDSQK